MTYTYQNLKLFLGWCICLLPHKHRSLVQGLFLNVASGHRAKLRHTQWLQKYLGPRRLSPKKDQLLVPGDKPSHAEASEGLEE